MLLALRDIEPLTEPAWRYLSPALAAAVSFALAVAVALLLVYRRRRVNHPVHQARIELDRIAANHDRTGDDRACALALAQWLKRIALIAFPDRRVESLSGSRWLAFLDDSMGDVRFSEGGGSVFGGDVYRKQVKLDAEGTVALCGEWLTVVTPRLRRRGRDRC